MFQSSRFTLYKLTAVMTDQEIENQSTSGLLSFSLSLVIAREQDYMCIIFHKTIVASSNKSGLN